MLKKLEEKIVFYVFSVIFLELMSFLKYLLLDNSKI